MHRIFVVVNGDDQNVVEIIFLVKKVVSFAGKSSSSRSIVMQEFHSCNVGCVSRSLEQM